MKKNNGPGLKISGSNGYWMRIYHRSDYACYLCNFCPMGCNGLLPRLERIISIEEISMFQDVDMAFIIAKKGKGVPVVDLTEFLNKIQL